MATMIDGERVVLLLAKLKAGTRARPYAVNADFARGKRTAYDYAIRIIREEMAKAKEEK